jgi:adenine phosphoribosyltransferase
MTDTSATPDAIEAARFIKERIRSVPDFPKPGIVFRDITTFLLDPQALRLAVDTLVREARSRGAEIIVGIESRGFIFGCAVATQLGVGFVPVRKPGKLPGTTTRETYELEYGTDALEIHDDALRPGQKVLIVDDLLATGGTAAATVRLVEKTGAEVCGLAFVIELGFLGGRTKLTDHPVFALVHYDQE